MIGSFEVWIIVATILACMDVFVIVRLIMGRRNSKKAVKNSSNQKKYLIREALGEKSIMKEKVKIFNYLEVSKSIHLDKNKKNNMEKSIDIARFEKKYLKDLKTNFKTKKVEAALYLSVLGTKKARVALEETLGKEKNSTISLYIANGLADIGDKESIPVLTSSLINASRFYRDKVNMLIADFGEDFYNFLPEIMDSNRIEMKELIVDFSSVYYSNKLKTYLINMIDTREGEIDKISELYGNEDSKSCINCLSSSPTRNKEKLLCKYKGEVSVNYLCSRYKVLPVSINSINSYRNLVVRACNIVADYYPKVFDHEKYLYSEDLEIRNIAVRALANFQAPDKMEKLFVFLKEEETVRSAVNAISNLTEKNPIYFNQVINAFLKEESQQIKGELVKILALKIEYFIMKLSQKNNDDAKEIIKEILLLGRTSEVIDFLNKNKDINIENELISIIKEIILKSEILKIEFTVYLNDRLLVKCGLISLNMNIPKREDKKDEKLIGNLFILLLGSTLLVPIIYVMRHWKGLFKISILEHLEVFVLDFNYYIAFYAMAVNLIYFILLVFSYISVNKQERLWNIKDMSLLFKKKMLPSISIIAPAYNEEKTIIESVNSLLNLKYQDYELIIVNDGSKDNTLNTLIEYYDLKRVDYIYQSRLNTKQLRGVYLNRTRPKLIVVDKSNGGKADSLNVGINIANKEYICGIDADSLLEEDALLKLASLTLDEEVETPALGGNILPINGCTVEYGQIEIKGLSKNKLVRFQTIEYIRSFMSGRLGWSFFNSLLIISGAFGLFRKERVVNVGGYLTSSGKYKKDTVGEDMELVVRISKQMKEIKHKFKIVYSYNANCWTEVPEDFRTLKKQRFRWHKGLIEILVFHRKMIFNPSYGRIGTVAMPYFFIFEMLGPIIEIQGYVMVVVAILLGMLNYEIALILFISMVLMGILVSISSLLISEKNGRCFATKELAILIVYAIIENFGVRQYFSFWRLGGYLSMFRKPVGWQKAERKGFTRN